MREIFLERYERLGHRLTGSERTRQAIRVNTLRSSASQLLRRLEARGIVLSRVDWLTDGFHVEGSPHSVGATFEYLLGMYSIQEAAAQFPVQVLDPVPGERVLDMCAAPGGKTTQAAAWMRNEGCIVAADISRSRLYALENNLERCGVENCIAYWGDVTRLDYHGTRFDRILLDAPCSGNFVNDRAWFQKRDLNDIKKNSMKQRALLSSGVELLKPGGTLIYTTCSLEPEEDELNVQWLIENTGVALERIEGPGSPALVEVFGEMLSPAIANCRRFWPDETGTQGFFVAKVIKP